MSLEPLINDPQEEDSLSRKEVHFPPKTSSKEDGVLEVSSPSSNAHHPSHPHLSTCL